MKKMKKHIPGTIPEATQARLKTAMPFILEEFGTPCFVYDQQGIQERGHQLHYAMRHVKGFQQFYAVKAWPNPYNLALQRDMGFGFDCSSPYELHLMKMIGGVFGKNIIFTSNNTKSWWFGLVNGLGGIINFDDISHIEKVKDFPELVSFRVNPGNLKRAGTNAIIGEPVKAKYGITWQQMVPAYRKARQMGAREFGMHMMLCSNCLDEESLIETVRLGFMAMAKVHKALGIHFRFFNMGGGFGIPYKPVDTELNIYKIGERIAELQHKFATEFGFTPAVFTEMGRWMTGPFGVLVLRAINRKRTYQNYVGVDAGMEALARHAFYGSYHHVEVLNAYGRRKEKVTLVGSICENWDRVASDRLLAKITTGETAGDVLMVANCGAHATAMGSNYNGKTRLQEVMMKFDRASGITLELIRRAEMNCDLDATLNFTPKVVAVG